MEFRGQARSFGVFGFEARGVDQCVATERGGGEFGGFGTTQQGRGLGAMFGHDGDADMGADRYGTDRQRHRRVQRQLNAAGEAHRVFAVTGLAHQHGEVTAVVLREQIGFAHHRLHPRDHVAQQLFGGGFAAGIAQVHVLRAVEDQQRAIAVVAADFAQRGDQRLTVR